MNNIIAAVPSTNAEVNTKTAPVTIPNTAFFISFTSYLYLGLTADGVFSHIFPVFTTIFANISDLDDGTQGQFLNFR